MADSTTQCNAKQAIHVHLHSHKHTHTHTHLQVLDADLAAARTALKGKYPRDLFNDTLGTWLTQRAHAVTSAVFVKVIANVRRRVRHHAPASRPGQEDCGGGTARQDGKTRQEDLSASACAYKNGYDLRGYDLSGTEDVRRQHVPHVPHAQHANRHSDPGGGKDGGYDGGADLCYYRSKVILAFRCLPGSVGDALTFGMYVHEYGAEAPPSFRGKVLLECIDGTPLFNGETADERQRCLSAIAQVSLSSPPPAPPRSLAPSIHPSLSSRIGTRTSELNCADRTI